jgi:serine/threonine protein kinase
LESAFDQLKLPRLAHSMKLSSSELKAQNMVDMKRLTDILVKMSQQNRSDAIEPLSRRFKSLRKMNIKVDPSARTSLQIPELPANLEILIKESDVKIIKELARGQSGTVYIGNWKGREVAVKVFRARVLSPSEIESFRREIYVLANLTHPAVLSMLGFTDVAPFYIVTEYLKNESLFKCLRKNPDSLRPTRRTIIAYDIARGLEFLHSSGVIHRDMKSLNVLLTDDFRAKICDFGAVRLHITHGVCTGSIGTAHWMAPEILLSCPSYDFKVDVFSFGWVLWELLTMGLLYDGMSTPEVIEFVLAGNRPEIPEGTPGRLERLIRSCWDADPKLRPPMARIVGFLSDPDYHFEGTDEAEFRNATCIVYRHRTTHSQSYQRKGKLVSGAHEDDITGLFSDQLG